MLMMRALLLASVLFAACSRRDVRVAPDPEKAPPPRTPIVAAPLDRFMVGGRVVSVAARAVLFDFAKKPPTFSELDRESAFVVSEGVVRAFDTKSGKERWHVTPAQCRHFTMTTRDVYCAGDHDIHVLSKQGGALRTIGGSTGIQQLLGLDDHLIVLRHASTLESYPQGANTAANTAAGPLHAYRPLVRDGEGFCGAVGVATGVFAGCWSANLTPRWTKTIALARPGEPLSGFDARRLDHGFLVAGRLPWSSGPMRSVVVRLADGEERARVDEDVAATTSRDGREVHGLVSTKGGIRYLDPTGAVLWAAPKSIFVEESADALIDGDRVFLALYSSIAAGANLYALDARTGALLWKHTPAFPPIAHSAYLNEVDLSLVSDVLVMRGHEAGVEYASLLDRAGALKTETLLPLWSTGP